MRHRHDLPQMAAGKIADAAAAAFAARRILAGIGAVAILVVEAYVGAGRMAPA
jgi:hypothetical protein